MKETMSGQLRFVYASVIPVQTMTCTQQTLVVMMTFTNERNVESAKKTKIKEVDAALVLLLQMVTSNKDKMWTTVDLYEQYIKDGVVKETVA